MKKKKYEKKYDLQIQIKKQVSSKFLGKVTYWWRLTGRAVNLTGSIVGFHLDSCD